MKRLLRVGPLHRAFVLLAVSAATACGGSPTSSSPAPSTPAAPVSLAYVTDVYGGEAQIVYLYQQPASMAYSVCARIDVSAQQPTVTVEVFPIGKDGRPYASTGKPYTYQSVSSVGCLGWVAYDFDFTHPIADHALLHVTYQSTDGRTGVTDVPFAIDEHAALPPRLQINEFRTRGPNGPTDQFVELYNDSLTPFTAGAQLIARPNYYVTYVPTVVIPPVTIGPLCHYLITAPGYSGSTPGDLQMSAMFTDEGALVFRPTFALGTDEDHVGMGSPDFQHEGTPLAPFGSDNSDRSYARTGPDTNDNAHDFTMQIPSTPKNSASCGAR